MFKMFCRFFHVSCVVHNSKKQGIKLCKMLNPNSKRQWHPALVEQPTLPSVKSLTKQKHQPGKSGLRRVAMLNKVFMKQVTDIMSTGTMSMDIVGRGIEISKVKITPDFRTLNVFWVCKGNATDDETEKLLNQTAGALRHELSTLRAMGEVPYISFVKDRQEAQIIDLDRRLATADYGEDYSPSKLGDVLKSEFTLNTKLSPEIKAKIKQLEDSEPIMEVPLPEMTHTVYGLDHGKIMSRLLAARKKTKDAWDNINVDPVISYRVSDTEIINTNDGQQKRELAEFLLKRQIEQNKLRKQMQKSESYDLTQSDDFDEEIYEDEDEEDDDDYDGEFNYYNFTQNTKNEHKMQK